MNHMKGVKFLGLFNKDCGSVLLISRGGVPFSYLQSFFVSSVIESLILVLNLFVIRVTYISCSVHIMCHLCFREFLCQQIEDPCS